MCRGLYFLFNQKKDASAIWLNVTKFHVNLTVIQRSSDDAALNSTPPPLWNGMWSNAATINDREKITQRVQMSRARFLQRLAISQSTSISWNGQAHEKGCSHAEVPRSRMQWSWQSLVRQKLYPFQALIPGEGRRWGPRLFSLHCGTLKLVQWWKSCETKTPLRLYTGGGAGQDGACHWAAKVVIRLTLIDPQRMNRKNEMIASRLTTHSLTCLSPQFWDKEIVGTPLYCPGKEKEGSEIRSRQTVKQWQKKQHLGSLTFDNMRRFLGLSLLH